MEPVVQSAATDTKVGKETDQENGRATGRRGTRLNSAAFPVSLGSTVETTTRRNLTVATGRTTTVDVCRVTDVPQQASLARRVAPGASDKRTRITTLIQDDGDAGATAG